MHLLSNCSRRVEVDFEKEYNQGPFLSHMLSLGGLPLDFNGCSVPQSWKFFKKVKTVFYAIPSVAVI